MNTSASARNRSPFTATQWQELEQQALIFKYMVSGAPVPPDLIYSIKRSLDSSISSRLYPYHPIGWGCFEMGFGRKVDPEPGRCRRTDGKKWRCSKEAYPDSKYCERHMHRGRNRSRKPVEVSSTTSINTNTSQGMSSYNNINLSSVSNPSTTSSFSFSPLPSSVASSESHPFSHTSQNSSFNPFFYPPSSSNSSKPSDIDFSPQNNTTHQLFLDTGSCSQGEKDYRHIHGMREGLDEKAFFPEASKTSSSFPDSYQQLSMGFSRSLSNFHFQNNNDSQTQEEHHCFVLGTDFKSPKPFRCEKESETSTIQRPLHHFFGDHWSPKNTDSWLDLASNSRIPNDE